MKKNVLKFLTAVIAFSLSITVKAYYNGAGGITANVPTGSGCTATTPMCYNGSSSENGYFFLQARLYYIDNTGGKFEWSDGKGKIDSPVGSTDSCQGTYFFADSTSKKKLVSFGIPSSCIYNMDGQTGTYNGSTVTWTNNLGKDGSRYAKMSAVLRHYFGDDVNQCEGKICTPNDNLKKFLNGVTTGSWDTSDAYAAELTKDSQVAITSAKSVSAGATKGYRLIIEPVLIWNYTGTSYKSGLYTPKQAASYGFKNTSASKPFTGASGQAQYLFTDFSDVGIDYGSHNWCSTKASTKDLADWKIGCGMNIIDVGKYVSVHYCYEKSIAGSLTCVNYDKNNESDSFKETYTKKECTAEQAAKNTNTEYGKKVADNNNCTLYCSESAFASFPGGISQPFILDSTILTNGYFAWPARYGSNLGMKMYMTSTFKCRVVQKEGKTCSSDDVTAMISAAETSVKKLNIGAKLTAGNNRKINAEELVVGNTTTSKDNTSGLKIDGGKTDEFSVSKTTYLEIKTNTNRYFNKSTGAVSDDYSSWIGTSVFDRGQGVVSLSEKLTEVGKKYDLTISDVQLGTGNQYGKRINNYTCKYEVGISCVCPAGTIRAGDDLYLELTEGKSCAELQRTECNICECPDDSFYGEWGKDLTDKFVGIPITSATCTKLQKKYCYHSCDDSKVSESTFNACVTEQVTKYKRTLGEATTICNEKYCPPKRCDRVPKETWDKCRDEGNSYAACYKLYCPYPGCKDCTYHCKTVDGVEKDISQCISDRQAKYGETFRDAKVRCTAVACPSNSNECENGKCPPEGNNCTGKCTWSTSKKGNKIVYTKTCDGKVCSRYPVYCANNKCIKANNVVYRTIDLNNPFPSNNGKGVTTEFSNDGIKGRIPSTNWNYTETVKKEILNARGVKGEKLYTEKTPLYTITLTPSLIKEIREYNKGKDYSDFRLECKNENQTAACISDFLHTTIYSSIDRSKSVANCYNISKDEAGFDACYNKDN